MNQSETLPLLNAELLKSDASLGYKGPVSSLPEKVLQFGEGNFLRGFADWMIHGMNQKGLFGGSVVVVQPVAQGLIPKLNQQNGLYTLLMRGVQDGKVVEDKELITSISRGIDPYTDFQEFLRCAHNPDLRWIISNTTEAGIAYSASDQATDQPPSSYPGKLTALLVERYKAFDGDRGKGFILLPCELIDRNGDNLKKAVLQTAANWKLDADFVEWVQAANIFTNTLVDRIVTGYPRDEAGKLWKDLGYQDDLLDCAEVFHLWVIEAPSHVAKDFPLAEAGFNVIWTDDMTPYRERKVRILNGAHTCSVLAAYLAGDDYVGELMKNPLTGGFMKKAIQDEVIRTLTLSKEELEKFANAVFERFSNPFIKHSLLDISLNSVSKFKARVLPSFEKYVSIHGSLPVHLTFSLAALIAFYRGTEIREGALIGHRDDKEYRIKDDLAVLTTFSELWSQCDGSAAAVKILTDGVLQKSEWWGKDLRKVDGLSDAIAKHLQSIVKNGIAYELKLVERDAEIQSSQIHLVAAPR